MGNPVRYVDPTGKAAAAVSVLDALAAAIAQAAGEVSAGAVAGAASAGTVVGVGAGVVAGGISLACLLDLDGCRAAWDGFCEEQGIDPNILSSTSSEEVGEIITTEQECLDYICSESDIRKKKAKCHKLKGEYRRDRCRETVHIPGECEKICGELRK